MIAVKIGTISWRTVATLAVDEVEYVGEWIYAADGMTSLMVWDDALGNARAMTQAEIDALPAQIATATAQAEKAAAIQGVDDAFTQVGGRVARGVMSAATAATKAINQDRQTFAAMNSAVQAATSLADLKTRFAAINFPSQITTQQVMNAVKADIAATPE